MKPVQPLDEPVPHGIAPARGTIRNHQRRNRRTDDEPRHGLEHVYARARSEDASDDQATPEVYSPVVWP